MWKRRIAAGAALLAGMLSVAGCVSMDDVYVSGATGGYVPPAEGSPVATLIFTTAPEGSRIEGTTILNLPITAPFRAVYYKVSRNPIRSHDKIAAQLFRTGATAELVVHVHRPVYVSASSDLTSYTCDNSVVFQAEAGHKYMVTQVYAGVQCAIQVLDLTTHRPVPVDPVRRG